MSPSPTNQQFVLLNPSSEHFEEIQNLCRRVYPFSKPWSLAQLQSHQAHFPEGQLIVIERETGKVLGLAFSLIISWDDYSSQDSWEDFTSAGYFHNHNPKRGKTLYGAEVMVDPEYRGQGIGKLLYAARREIVRRYQLKRIRAGARLRGYGKYAKEMSPEEYTREVMANKIFDPTLSFQLGADFVVLDVARNYLYNDPESLGYAAVIEWLNPEIATERDFKKQHETVQAFLSDEHFGPHLLPRELRHLVRKMTHMLGQVIKEYEGDSFFSRLEKYRVRLKKLRKKTNPTQLNELSKKVLSESHPDQLKIAHAFALLMELVNVCEAAYRTWRMQQKPTPKPLAKKAILQFVLASHPAEARSTLVMETLAQLAELLLWGLQSNFDLDERAILSKIRLLWKSPLGSSKKPALQDEGAFVSEVVFRQPIFDFILRENPSYQLHLSTWAGGNRENFPHLNGKAVIDSLRISRNRILGDIKQKLLELSQDLAKAGRSTRGPHSLAHEVQNLAEITNGDFGRIRAFKNRFDVLRENSDIYLREHENIFLIQRIFELFPSLVLPIYLRERYSGLRTHCPLEDILRSMGSLAKGPHLLGLIKGLVISDCESVDDLVESAKLVKRGIGDCRLPISPMFSTLKGIEQAKKIISSWLENHGGLGIVREQWNNQMEIVLGYEDLSRSVGELSARYHLQSHMVGLYSLFKSHKIRPLFCHGVGASIHRGNGSLKEQIGWWSQGAISQPKITIQDEMVQRLFASEELLNNYSLRLSKEFQLRRTQKVKSLKNPAFQELNRRAEEFYRSWWENSSKLENLLSTLPYQYLRDLRFKEKSSQGQPLRPTLKGNNSQDFHSGPWRLAWTQSRSFLPVWWGLGSAWAASSAETQQVLQKLVKENDFFSSLIKSVGFALARTEPEIFCHYLRRKSSQPIDQSSHDFENEFRSEFLRAKKFVIAVTGEKSLIWFRPWLEESIRLRSAYLHILNLLQLTAMDRRDEELMRTTVIGLTSGMMTSL